MHDHHSFEAFICSYRAIYRYVLPSQFTVYMHQQLQTVYLTDKNIVVWIPQEGCMYGVDYFKHHEIGRIVENAYISQPQHQQVQRRLSLWNTAQYLKTTCDSSILGYFDHILHKFNCNDFAVCMKDAFSKYYHDQTKPDNREGLCGIMCGRKIHSFTDS